MALIDVAFRAYRTYNTPSCTHCAVVLKKPYVPGADLNGPSGAVNTRMLRKVRIFLVITLLTPPDIVVS
jgi:hypothetical protein